MGVVKINQKVVNKAGFAGPLFSGVDAISDITPRLAKVVLTAAQVKALYTTPITLVAAPGANSYIAVDKIIAALDYSGAVFTGANNVEFRETNGSGTKISADLTSAFLNGSADAIAEIGGLAAQTARLLNQAIVAAVPVANPGGASATSTLALSVYYRVVTPY